MDQGATPSARSSDAGKIVTDVAIVHDYITQRGGAERLLLSVMDAYPTAPVYTSFYEPSRTYEAFQNAEVIPAPINRYKVLRDDPRRALPLLARTFDRVHVDAELAICSSSGWAHGADVTGQRLVYCHNPARWLYQTDQYLPGKFSPVRAALGVLRGGLERWDQSAARSADRYLSNSTVVAQRVLETYGIESEVLFPAVSVDTTGEAEPYVPAGDDFFLVVARLLAYKGVEAVVEAFAGSAHRLVVVGEGPLLGHLRRIASKNVILAGALPDEQLRWLYRNTTAVITAAYEDFGLVPLEAAAYGKPTLALRYGGHLDTVIHGETGWFFDERTPSCISAAVDECSRLVFDETILTAHALAFSPDRFIHRLRSIVAEMIS